MGSEVPRPVFAVPFTDALRSAPLLHGRGIQAISDLNMQCLCRAYYGGYRKAALAMVVCGIRSAWLTVRVDLTMFWALKIRRMTEAEMERRYFS